MGNKTENTTEKSRLEDQGGTTREDGLLYRILASRLVPALILAAIAAVYIGPAILGGGHVAQYSLSGERLVVFPGSPSLPAFFSSPSIKILSMALYVTLAAGVYSIVRESGALKKGLGGFTPTHTISLTQNSDEAEVDARRALTGTLGLSVKGEKGGWVVLEKGPPYKLLLWAYYAGIAVFLAAIALSNLGGFEKTVTLTRGLPTEVEAPGGTKLWVETGPFTVRHTGIRTSENPTTLLYRLAGPLKRQGGVYEVMDGKYYPLDWALEVKLREGGATAGGFITTGTPLEYGPLSFRLESIRQTFRLRVEDNPLVLVARGGEELVIPGIGPGLGLPVRFTPFLGGALERSDGTTEEIAPHTRLKLASGEGEELGTLEPGKSIYINGVRLTLIGVVEKYVLGYTRDPGFPLLMPGVIILLATAALRIFGFWQTAAYRVDSSSQIIRLQFHVKSRGLFASSERLVRRLTAILTAEDIRPIPIPGERLK